MTLQMRSALTRLLAASNSELGAPCSPWFVCAKAEPEMVNNVAPAAIKSLRFRGQLLFFLDGLIPKLFDKPLLSDKPERDQISWH
jgi:hypothetical protein